MIGYQQAYRPAYARLAQASAPASVLPPSPDPLYTGYTGLPGFAEGLLVLTITGAAAWAGIRTGLSEKKNPYLKIAGWIGGVGSAVLGVLYLGAKSNITDRYLPAVRIVPA